MSVLTKEKTRPYIESGHNGAVLRSVKNYDLLFKMLALKIECVLFSHLRFSDIFFLYMSATYSKSTSNSLRASSTVSEILTS